MIFAVVLVTLLVTSAVVLALGYVDLHRRRRDLRVRVEAVERRRHEVQVAELALGAMVGELPRPLVSVN